MEQYFSFIIPVYNRPQEIKELLDSILRLNYQTPFEVVIVEDGSGIASYDVVESFKKQLDISYFRKENTGPGDSRNFGMKRAKGNYFIILDSDCLLPENYLKEVEKELSTKYVDCFGGPDAAHESFTLTQKAINYSMTSFFTTGGIRGGKAQLDKFQPRSFNMGISKKAFEATGGFGNIHPGEDPDLTFRIWDSGFETRLFPKAYVYHKRRVNWNKFFTQVHKFGKVRPILNTWHPGTRRITYWLPTVFFLVFCLGLILLLLGNSFLIWAYILYFLAVLLHATTQNKSVLIGVLAVFATMVQLFGYGIGFLTSTVYLMVGNKPAEQLFPELFFTKNQS